VDVRVLAVRRERLDEITADEVGAEGFPEMSPADFAEFFCASHKGSTPVGEVNWVEWSYLEPRVEQGTSSKACAVEVPV
jgi:hypothetical protein